MRLGIMQPYIFPYIGYYKLIANTDYWCVFDTVQYTKKTWMNRNRILHPVESWQYFTVPVKKHHRKDIIADIEVVDLDATCNLILGQLNHYKKYAPYFKESTNVVKKTFSETSSPKLTDLNISSLKTVCEYLDIRFDYCICSEANFSLPPIKHPGQWALEISSLLKAKEYLNPIGGQHLFKENEFSERGIKLLFQETPVFKYTCNNYKYHSNLSIIDVIMWCSKEKISTFLFS